MPFHGWPDVKQLPSGKWKLQDVLEYETPEGKRIVVPAGFETDFASVPWLLRGWVARWSKTARAAIVHDWLYYSHETSRPEADRIFRVALEESNFDAPEEDEEEDVGWWSQWAMWFGVRVGGYRAYHRA